MSESTQPLTADEQKKKNVLRALARAMLDTNFRDALLTAVGELDDENAKHDNAERFLEHNMPGVTTQDIREVADDFCDRTMVGYDAWPFEPEIGADIQAQWREFSDQITTAETSYISHR